VTPSAARLSFERPPPGYIASAQDPCTSTYRGRRVPNPTTPRARSDGRNANTCRVPTRRAAEARRGASDARSCTRAARAAGEADAARAPARSSFSSVSQRAPRAHGNTYAGATTPPTRTTAHAQRRRCSFARFTTFSPRSAATGGDVACRANKGRDPAARGRAAAACSKTGTTAGVRQPPNPVARATTSRMTSEQRASASHSPARRPPSGTTTPA